MKLLQNKPIKGLLPAYADSTFNEYGVGYGKSLTEEVWWQIEIMQQVLGVKKAYFGIKDE